MRNSQGRIGPGASTVLMILIVLMMTMLGVLALTSARNDRGMSRRAEESAIAYYNAQTDFGLWIKSVDETLLTLRARAGSDADAYEQLVSASLGVTVGGELEYSGSAGEFRNLFARVRVLPLTETDRILVLSKYLEPVEEPEEDITWTLIA